ncbi:hypothetical protein [Nonomuraea sp. NPDC049709]|uniref:hypothetical protein n=1 Tax=Nonomuraea sp. NPDC049709 TaxID=3154736 RepID=UPI00342B50F1
MPEKNEPEGGKRTKILLWAGGILTAVITAWATDALSLIVRPADLLGLGKPALRATVLPATGRNPHLAVPALPVTPRDRAIFLTGRFDDPAFLDLAGRLGGAWVEWMRVRVVFEADRAPVRITDVRVKEVTGDRPNITGAFVEFPSETAEQNPQLTVDLDAPRRFFTSAGRPGQPYFGRQSLSLKQGEQTELGLEIRAGARSHAFNLEVEYVPGGGDRAERITVTDQAGRPFRVTGAPERHTGYGTVYLNTGVGLRAATGRAACVFFEPDRACDSGR